MTVNAMIPFTHLHVHSQYSILDGAASIESLVNKAKAGNMKALALTDHGAMFGIKEFHVACNKAGIKPILGCETYVAQRSMEDRSGKEDRSGDHLVLLAKNITGYHNLIKLVSLANMEGFYYKPRIDKATLERHSEGLMASSACLGGEIPSLLGDGRIKEAEEALLWYRRVFGDDFFLEVQRHPSDIPELRREVYDRQVVVNALILDLARKYGIKVIATNDVHFTDAQDADAHDLLICLNTGKDLDDPNRMRYTKQEWFKTTEEMNQLFADLPEALQNTMEVADRVEVYAIDQDPIMPVFPIPESFGTEAEYRARYSEEELIAEFSEKGYQRLGGYDKVVRIKFESEYLRHLVYQGAPRFYGNPLPEDVVARLDFELDVIMKMGYPGYFLITQDFINAARNMGVLVGPGRGSAAGAAVSYCTGITNIDPIRHNLLFERFLNPERVSLPDVDIDFDDDGRQQVLDWVVDKYGKDKVAHICTFATMATKMAIRDVARVLKLPLPEADRLAKLVPEAPKMTFKKAFQESPELKKERQSANPLIAKTIQFAEILEGSVRQSGVHACGILISRNPLTDHIPLMPTKDDNLPTTQYDGRFVENLGLLKMDFLGLKTLSIIKESIENIRLSRGITLDIDTIPFDDPLTYEMFSKGETTAVFQFESEGMKKHLRELKPNRFEDLVAMNALYRPGPMDYIPEFIARKNGKKKVEYDLPMMEEYLSETYGITVYQEQVMLLSRLLANFTRGESDTLRKAMGKKMEALMAKLKERFVEGCTGNPRFIEECRQVNKVPKELIEKIWGDWESFASYAFNKSHSVCYAHVAYQTGYLKAHYPAEFMAANLSRNLSHITEITKFMQECQRMKLNVKGPDINESYVKFTVNRRGDIRFGMAAVKGVGEGVVNDIVAERKKGGDFRDIFDFAERVNLQSVNKKTIEALAMAGAFDSFGSIRRSQFFAGENENDPVNFIERLIRYGSKIQSESQSMQQTLFGDSAEHQVVRKPEIPPIGEWPQLVLLEKEKGVIGIYLTAHPLDDYRLELDNFCSRGIGLKEMNEQMEKFKDQEFTFGGMVTEASEGFSKNGKPYSKLTLSDYTDSKQFFFFNQDYVEFGKYCKPGLFVLIKGKVQKRFSSETLEFRVTHIELLSQVRRNHIKSLTVHLPLSAISEGVVEEMERVLKNNKGNALLKFQIFDEERQHSVHLFSRNSRIEVSNDFLRFFEEHPEMAFRIN